MNLNTEEPPLSRNIDHMAPMDLHSLKLEKITEHTEPSSTYSAMPSNNRNSIHEFDPQDLSLELNFTPYCAADINEIEFQQHEL